MQRVLKTLGAKSLFLIPLLALAQASYATTVVVPSDDEMIIGARVILRGKVVDVESSFDEHHSRIYTYITVKVQEVIKGEIADRFLVLKELGGQVGDRGLQVFGNPVFTRGEKVLLYLDTWKNGSLRTYQMFLGKFSITVDKSTGQQIVVRSGPDENVDVLPSHAQTGAITDRMNLSSYLKMVRNRLQVNWEQSQSFNDTYYRSMPLLAEPAEYQKLRSQGDIRPLWTYIHPAHPRWFEPDTGQTVNFMVNPAGAPQPNILDDVGAAMNAWSTVANCALRVGIGGTTSCSVQDCSQASCHEGIGLNLIQFDSCDGRWGHGGGCSGTLALGGLSWFGGNTKIINGVTFAQGTAGFVSINPNSACFFGTHCRIQEVLTHELGHAMGLGHSTDTSATMYAIAHFDGRCASLTPDDTAAVQFIYPGTGGGPGPLTVTTTSLANGVVNTAYSQALAASGGTAPYSWSIVAGLGSLPPGLTLTASTGVIAGTPTTTGTYDFTVRVTDAVPATADKALSIVVSNAGAIPYNSQFVSQSTPTSVTPGQSFSVNMKWLNTGTQTWSAPVFYMVSQNPAYNNTWLGGQFNAVDLGQFTVPPGQQIDFTFTAIAPITPGTYNFQWQLYKDNGTTFFGQPSTNVSVQVGAGGGGTDNASFASQSVPTLMMKSTTHTVTVIMNNTGTTTWSAGNYYIGSQNPQGNTTWSMNRVNLASPVAPGAQGTFAFVVTSPPSPGAYNFQWQMGKDGAGFFGAMSTNLAVTVSNINKQAILDIDGDGKADMCYYRNGVWGVLKSSQGYSTSAAQFFSWGGPGLAPIVADFDGDGKADLAYIVPPAGGQSAAYAILKSSLNYDFGQALFVSAGFPSLGDTSVVGDFDGDGKADPGIWRSSQGIWIIPLSSSNYTSFIFKQWGQSGDTPIVADLDGDGMSDFGYYRNGVWGMLKSSQGYSTGSAQFFSWGGAGLQPIIADFDGDARADLAYLVPPSQGQSQAYAILKSSKNYDFGQAQFVPAGFPSLGDTAIVADFDGDGKAEPGVWRESQGVWILPLSSTGYTGFIFNQWGQSGDKAVPATPAQN